ncbi:MAG: hypothetical protein JWP95_493 [Actinotalea sp.]|nr:hypothetical protein [Actinotalea sp.]
MRAHRAPSPTLLRRGATPKIVATAAIVGAAAVVMSGGIYAAWVSGGAHQQGIATATLTGEFNDVGTNTFAIAVANAIPGDSVTRYTTLKNTGTVAQNFTVSMKGLGTLTGPAEALRVHVAECNQAWGVDGTCAGVATDAIVDTFLTDTGQSVQVSALAPAGQRFYKIVLTLDAATPQSYEGQTDSITVAATGVAAAAGSDRSAG